MLMILRYNFSFYVLTYTNQIVTIWIQKRQRNKRSNCQHLGSQKKQDSSRKISTSALLTTSKLLTVWITTNCGKFFKRWECQTTLPASCEIYMQVKKQQLELNMDQRTCSKLEKEQVKAVYCHRAYLTYMQRTSCDMLGWTKHKLESRLLEEISITSDIQMILPLWQKAKN